MKKFLAGITSILLIHIFLERLLLIKTFTDNHNDSIKKKYPCPSGEVHTFNIPNPQALFSESVRERTHKDGDVCRHIQYIMKMNQL